MKRPERIMAILLAAATTAGAFWIAAHFLKACPPASLLFDPDSGGGSPSRQSAGLVHHAVLPTVATQSVIVRAGASGGGAGGRRVSSGDPKGASPQQNILLAMRSALAGNVTNDVVDLLKMIRENPTAHATSIVALARDDAVLPSIRAMMLKSMGNLRDATTLDALIQLSKTLAEPILRAESVKALGQRTEHEAEARLRVIADDPKDPARAMATSFLGIGAARESRELLTGQLTDPASSPELRNAALYAMRRFDDHTTVATLMQILNGPSVPARERATALYSLGVIGDDSGLPLVKANLDSPDREVRYSATLAATRISDSEISAHLVTSLCDSANFPHVRKAASHALICNASQADLDSLRRNVQKTDGYGIRLACDVFVGRNDAQAVSVLSALSQDISDAYVIEKIEGTIVSLQGGK